LWKAESDIRKAECKTIGDAKRDVLAKDPEKVKLAQGRREAREQKAKEDKEQAIATVKRAGPAASNEPTIDTKTDGPIGPRRLGWGEGAEEKWEREIDLIRDLPEGRKRDIYARAPEIAVRLATILAWWRGSEVVEVEDWDWGWGWAELSCGLVLKGANEQMKVKREFGKICAHIKSLLAPGPMKLGEIHALSRSAAGHQGMEIVDKALADLILSEEAEELSLAQQAELKIAPKGAGRPPRWFRLIQR